MSEAQLDHFKDRVKRIERAPWQGAYATPGSAEDADHKKREKKTRRPKMKRKKTGPSAGWIVLRPIVALAYGAAAAFVVAAYWPQVMPLIEGPQPYEGDPRYLAAVAVAMLLAIGWMVLRLRGKITALTLLTGAVVGAAGVYAPERLIQWAGPEAINIARALVDLPPVFT